MSGEWKFPTLDCEGRELTMSFGACRQGLLSPARWFAIICAIATAVNLHEELTNVLVMKAMLVSFLSSASRFSPAHTSLAADVTQKFLS
jgi:hypothetical protein